MANYKKLERDGELFVQGSLDSLLSQYSDARAIWAGLERLDFSEFDKDYHNDKVGRAALHPRTLAAVWILAILRSDTSSLRLARLCETDIEYRWLLGGRSVEKSCLCDFRQRNIGALTRLGAQVLVALGQVGLLPSKQVGVDGTVVRAAASRHTVRKRKDLERQVDKVQKVLVDKLSEGETAESENLQALDNRLKQVQKTLARMQQKGLSQPDDKMTTTEPSASLMRQKDKSFAPGYNIQVVADLETGVIIQAEVIEGGSDSGQLLPQIEKAQAVLEHVRPEPGSIQSVVADAGYHDTRQLAALEEQGITCYVPADRTDHRDAPDVAVEYQAKAFVYDEASDTMRCPQGKTLSRCGLNETQTSMCYRAAAHDCASCPAKAQCCPKTRCGRKVNRPLHHELLATIAERTASPGGKRQKAARGVTNEGVFARLCDRLHWKRCRMWDLIGAQAELAWRQLAHNLMLMMGMWKPLVIKSVAG